MRIYYLLSIFLFTVHHLSAQALSSDSANSKKFTYLAGIGVSSQYTNNSGLHCRLETKYRLLPKLDIYGVVAYTPESVGDTFSFLVQTFDNEASIIESISLNSSITSFTMVNFSLGLRYLVHDRVALRFAPSFTKITSGLNMLEQNYITTYISTKISSANRYKAAELTTIENNLYGLDVGLDFQLSNRLALNCSNYLMFTDVTDDDIYGQVNNRIMHWSLSLNYIIR